MPTSPDVLRFPGTSDGFEGAAAELRALLDARHVDTALRYKIEVAFEEIATNIIRHGAPTQDVEVTIAFDEREVVLTFEDDGVPFDPRERAAPLVPASIDEAVVGGLGLVLVRKLTTRMAYERTSQRRNRLTLAMPVR